MTPIPDLRGKRAVVMGLGLFGGGTAAARYLVRKGARVLVTDGQPAERLRESVDALAGLPIEMRLGEHREEDFRTADLVVANPAVRPDSPFLILARGAGAVVTSECELAANERRAGVVAVTGTNGKSTTTTLVGEMLRESGIPVWVGGNLGRSLLDDLDSIEEGTRIVQEVSSYQLETIDAPRGWPRVAVVTNLTPDHLDRHRTMEEYGDAKARILLRQREGDAAVLNADDPVVSSWGRWTRGRALYFGRGTVDRGVAIEGGALRWRDGAREVPIVELEAIPLAGAFNHENAAAAAVAALDLGAEPDAVARALRAFRGLPHRLEFLGTRDGVRVYDNAVSTVPESTIAALRSVPPPVVLVAGGRSKNLPLDALAREASGRAKRVVLYGASSGELADAIRAAGGPSPRVVASLAEAVSAAFADARPGDSLLYSPAFASFDQYRNFRERGAEFRRLVGFSGPPE